MQFLKSHQGIFVTLPMYTRMKDIIHEKWYIGVYASLIFSSN